MGGGAQDIDTFVKGTRKPKFGYASAAMFHCTLEFQRGSARVVTCCSQLAHPPPTPSPPLNFQVIAPAASPRLHSALTLHTYKSHACLVPDGFCCGLGLSEGVAQCFSVECGERDPCIPTTLIDAQLGLATTAQVGAAFEVTQAGDN